jgi:hypothetical protein
MRKVMEKKISAGNKRICSNGHIFFKSSDCPVCPICEKEKNRGEGFFSAIGAPARRALENAGIKTIRQLSKMTEAEILTLHGMGPASLPKLRFILKSKGFSFKK